MGLTFKTIQWNKLQKIESAQFSIDVINGLNVHKQVQPIPVVLTEDTILTIAGWAVDEKAKDVADSVYLTLDSIPIARAYYGVKRSDIAKHFKIDRYKYSGWEASIDLDVITMDEYKISLRIVSKDKKNYFEPESGILIKVIR